MKTKIFDIIVTILTWLLVAYFYFVEKDILVVYVLLMVLSFVLLLLLLSEKPSMKQQPNGRFIVDTSSPESEVYKLILDEELPYLTNRTHLILEVVHK